MACFGWTSPTITIRSAAAADIPVLLTLVNIAGSGLPCAAWRMATLPDEDPWCVGARQMLDPMSDIYFGHALVADLGKAPVAAVLAYALPRLSNVSGSMMPDFWAPTRELEGQAPGTRHVAFLATLPGWRGRGIGSQLPEICEAMSGEKALSVIVSETNARAHALYRRNGYRPKTRRRFIDAIGRAPGHDWILLRKPRGTA